LYGFYRKKKISIVKFFDKQQHHSRLLGPVKEVTETPESDFWISNKKMTMMTNPGLVNAG
jgi:hypothetical protein